MFIEAQGELAVVALTPDGKVTSLALCRRRTCHAAVGFRREIAYRFSPAAQEGNEESPSSLGWSPGMKQSLPNKNRVVAFWD